MGRSGEDADEKTLTCLRTALALNYLANVSLHAVIAD